MVRRNELGPGGCWPELAGAALRGGQARRSAPGSHLAGLLCWLPSLLHAQARSSRAGSNAAAAALSARLPWLPALPPSLLPTRCRPSHLHSPCLSCSPLPQFDDSVCGRCVRIRGTEDDAPGNSFLVKIVDECPTCSYGDVDLSTEVRTCDFRGPCSLVEGRAGSAAARQASKVLAAAALCRLPPAAPPALSRSPFLPTPLFGLLLISVTPAPPRLRCCPISRRPWRP